MTNQRHADPLEFPRIHDAYYHRVRAYAARLVGRDAADDVAQEVFIKIARSLTTLADPSKLASWIFAITINTVRDRARKHAIEAASVQDGDPADHQDRLSAKREPCASAQSPEDAAIRNEMIACYLEYVAQLPLAQYDVYVLAELEQLTNREIARRLSLSVGTVKIRLHRARASLHAELRRNCQCYHNERGELMAEPVRPTRSPGRTPAVGDAS